ncbi:hypothetical protein AXG93_17s1120 [Marchantia polymorpha subsp. ruderalis]|uniref:Uncharacterized protein n=1 Tax=Marchantia polymorpha subsp. ruderalis TaxID=1480154 RepID=A0A176VI31_MARPO|nr:hypothetical protein AXG93_17s1120 [Marchantia polymorpha subsp. ruderalis]
MSSRACPSEAIAKGCKKVSSSFSEPVAHAYTIEQDRRTVLKIDTDAHRKIGLVQEIASGVTLSVPSVGKATGDSGAITKRIEADTLQRLQALTAIANQSTERVSALLVSWVTSVKNDFGDDADFEDDAE